MKKITYFGVVGIALFTVSLSACGGGSTEATKYVESITLSAKEGTKTETGFDMVLEITETGYLNYSYAPVDASATFTLVSSDTNVATLATTSTEGEVKVNPIAEGEASVYVTAIGKDSKEVKSNELKVKITSNTKTNDDFELARTTFTDTKGEHPLNMQTIYSNSNAPHLDPLQESHVLVVPFGFTDSNLQSVQSADNVDRLNTAFFGTKEEIEAVKGWNSLASFYNTSSYGNVTFAGDVLPTWCVYNGTSSEFFSKNKNGLGVAAAEYARNWYLTQYEEENHGLLGDDAKPITYYDANKDGFLDLVWIVYSHPTGTTNDWWAYVTYTGNNSNKTKPAVKTLGFASIDWLDAAFNGYDTHTFIHETGHTFGLDDYYDYNNLWKPMGSVDFMDQNLGDHSMFSKFTLGWTAPWIVDDSAVITLRPGTTTGDCFILPSPNYNGTAFDEYIMVELMAPVGLAEQDYKRGYLNTKGYSQPGLRLTHVDARVYNGSRDTYLVDNPQDGIDFRVSNSKGGRIGVNVDSDYYYTDYETKEMKSYFSLVHLIESTIDPETNCMTTSSYNASNSSLFKKGNRFNLKPGVANGWADVFMPSKTNLWNKAKTITSWTGTEQEYEVDKTCTFNYSLNVLNIVEDEEYGYVATVKVTANAY